MEYIVKSTNRYLSKHNRDFKIKSTSIKYIRKLAKVNDKINRIELFESMKKEIDELLEDHNERVILEYFNISAWVNSKLEKVSFEEAIRDTEK